MLMIKMNKSKKTRQKRLIQHAAIKRGLLNMAKCITSQTYIHLRRTHPGSPFLRHSATYHARTRHPSRIAIHSRDSACAAPSRWLPYKRRRRTIGQCSLVRPYNRRSQYHHRSKTEPECIAHCRTETACRCMLPPLHKKINN